MLADSNDGEREQIPEWRLKLMLLLTNIYYTGALDMLNLLMTMYLVVFDIHLRDTYFFYETPIYLALII